MFIVSRILNPSLKDLNPSLEELKEIAKLLAKKRGIKGYQSMPEDKLLSALKASESLKESEKNFDDTKPKLKFSKSRTEKTRKQFNQLMHKFLNQK